MWWRLSRGTYRFIQEIGKGARSRVYLVSKEETGQDHQYFALKSFSIPEDARKSSQLKMDFQRQINFLSKLNHPGVIKLIDHGEVQNQLGKSFNIVTDWGKEGTIVRLITLTSERPHLQKARLSILRHYCAQLVQIINYLQNFGISHRDIKAQNFVIGEDYKLKLIDFESAIVFRQDKAAHLGIESEKIEDNSRIGSPHYISPEMLERSQKSQVEKFQCEKTDIWSMGILIFYMFTRQFPFDGKDEKLIIKRIKQNQVSYSSIENSLIIELLKLILKKNPKERADIQQVREARFFKGIQFQHIFKKESPYETAKNQSQISFFKGNAKVKIFQDTNRRVVQLISCKTDKSHQKKQILIKETSTTELLDIKKMQSEATELNSQKKIPSMIEESERRMFLSIFRPDSNSTPKFLQIDSLVSVEVKDGHCLLKNLKVKNKKIEEPIEVDLKFRSEEEMMKFISKLQIMMKKE